MVTVLALVLINVGLAGLIVEAVGARNFAPVWVTLVLLVLGAASAVAAVVLWRQYLRAAQDR
jgi:hypothetical protein